MSDVALRVERISKKFRLGSARPDTLRDRLASSFAFLHPQSAADTAKPEELWALRDVSFDVKWGDVVGLIGRNGAGKSTLLKIISHITEPTTGRVAIYGRVGSLLEVGTGFHPELSGRENIYLNGAILGMSRREIARKFDEIVAFAEVEKFLDTPVKRYSSGMYVRLAFAVAAHLEPEILIVDEVLAVGDAAFQRKCLARMGEVASEGRTVLFVSHNMAAVQSLCQRGILLRRGTLWVDDAVAASVDAYLKTLEETSAQSLAERRERHGRGNFRLTNIEITRGSEGGNVLATGRPAHFRFSVNKIQPGLTCGFTIYDHLGQPITHLNSRIRGPQDEYGSRLDRDFLCEVEELYLIPGRYRVNAVLEYNSSTEDHVEGAAFFEVAEGQLQGRPTARENRSGSVVLPHRWA